MRVTFCTGEIRPPDGEPVRASWGETAQGLSGIVGDEDEASPIDAAHIVSRTPMVSLDLPGLEAEDAAAIIREVLLGGFLEKPGAAGRGEALLHMVVNEALHRLDQAAKDLEDDES